MKLLIGIALLSLANAFPSNNPALDFQLPKSLESFRQISCPSNQHWSSCKSHCGKSCSNYFKDEPCPSICMPGCVCDEGYVWGPDEECILVSQCEPPKVELSPLESEDFCPPNEKFSKCLAHCDRNCSNWSGSFLPCQKICVPGCICQNGMVRGLHGTCIRPVQCPPSEVLTEIDVEIECPLDEHLVECTAHCQRNCSNWTKDIPCQNICVKGCVCDKGFVRSSTGRCILSEKCPSLQESQQERERETELVCPANEHKSKYQALPYSKNLCIFDETQITICPLNYLNGCVCNQGLFRDPDNKCVELRKLPLVNEIDFMHVVDLEVSEDYEDEDCHPEVMDKELMEYYYSQMTSPTEIADLSALDGQVDKSVSRDLLNAFPGIDSSNKNKNLS